MIRAFIAVALPENVLEQCEQIAEQIEKLGLEGRFVKKESIHLTLKFLGDIEEEQVSGIRKVLEVTALEFAPFGLEIRGVGAFPHLGNPRVIWIGVQGHANFTGIQERLEDRLADRDFPKENRPFHPHLTLARLKSRRNARELARYIQERGAKETAGFANVEQIHLYESILKPTGAQYRKLVSVVLGGSGVSCI